MKKLISLLLVFTLITTLTGCGKKTKFVVGVCQLAVHEALDSATQGFKDALEAEFGDDITVIVNNAAGDSALCTTICSGFVADGVDLILGNATGALQAASSCTTSIPVLGTSITEYGVALGIENFTGVVGNNVSGTSDLAPLDQQAEMFAELLPSAKTIGLVYCSNEPNSIYQVDVVSKKLESMGLKANLYKFADSNDIASITEAACQECDALYVPTDNQVAAFCETINNVASQFKKPIICGEKGTCEICGIASLSIDYYKLGVETGKMAVEILKGAADITKMEIRYDSQPVKVYNKEICEKLNIVVPEGYSAI